MSTKNSSIILMAFMAMSFFSPYSSYAQANPPSTFTSQIKTPDTTKELKKDEKKLMGEEGPFEEKASAEHPSKQTSAPRKLQQHGLGLGLGQTFLLGDFADHGKDKITVDILYSYAASYSFDLLVDAHMSEHKDNSERAKIMGVSGSIKARMVEYDNFSPFVLGGLGFYAPKAKRKVGDDYKWSDQKITFGMNLGGGVDLRLNDNYVVGVLAQYHWPFEVEQDTGPDLDGSYFKMLITGMYLF